MRLLLPNQSKAHCLRGAPDPVQSARGFSKPAARALHSGVPRLHEPVTLLRFRSEQLEWLAASRASMGMHGQHGDKLTGRSLRFCASFNRHARGAGVSHEASAVLPVVLSLRQACATDVATAVNPRVAALYRCPPARIWQS